MLHTKPHELTVLRTHGYLGRGVVFDRIFTAVTSTLLHFSRGLQRNFEVVLGATQREVLYLCVRCNFRPDLLNGELYGFYKMDFYIGGMTEAPTISSQNRTVFPSVYEYASIQGRSIISHLKFTKEMTIERAAHFLNEAVSSYVRLNGNWLNVNMYPVPPKLMNFVWQPLEGKRPFAMVSSAKLGGVDVTTLSYFIKDLLDEAIYVTDTMGDIEYLTYLETVVNEHEGVWKSFTREVPQPALRNECSLRYDHIFGIIGSMFERIHITFYTRFMLAFVDGDSMTTRTSTRYSMIPAYSHVRRSILEVLCVKIRMASYRIPAKFRDIYTNTWEGVYHNDLKTMDTLKSAKALQNILVQMNIENCKLYLEYVIRDWVASKEWYDVVRWLFETQPKEKLSQRLKRKREISKVFNTSVRAVKTAF